MIALQLLAASVLIVLALPAAGATAQEPQPDARRTPFSQLGALSPLELRGDAASATLDFGSRADELVTRAVFHFRYAYSPALAPTVAHIRLALNDQVVGVLPVAAAEAGKPVTRSIEVDPRLVVGFNKLVMTFVAVPGGTPDPARPGLWADISNASELEVAVQKLAVADDLAILPEPFFDRRDKKRVTIPFLFSAQPSQQSLRAAAVLASWFGKLATWRGTRFPVQLDGEAPGHAVAFAANDERPAFLASLPRAAGPGIRMMTNPADGRSRLLVLLGRDGADLKTAADALALGGIAMSGAAVEVKRVEEGAPRAAYDAPGLVRLDRPTRLGELIGWPQQLQAVGRAPELEPVSVDLRMPPDLVTSRGPGVPLALTLQYTPPRCAADARLDLGANDELLQVVTLRNAPEPITEVHQLFIPSYRLRSRTQLQFGFSFPLKTDGECREARPEVVKAVVSPESTVDFSGFPHHARMPELNHFATIGFPFTRYADLSQTVVVLPDKPVAADLEVMLGLMGRMGESTGYPATRVRVAGPKDEAGLGGADLLVIGATPQQSLLARWAERLPVDLSGHTRRVSQVSFEGAGPIAAMLGFESPVDSGRSVVAVTAVAPDQVLRVLDALVNRDMRKAVRGSAAFVLPGKVESVDLGRKYSTGFLPPWTGAGAWLRAHPLSIGAIGAVALGLLAWIGWRLRARVSARRSRGAASLLVLAVGLALLAGSGPVAAQEVNQLLERAEFWQQRQRDDLAREELGKVLRLVPDHPEALATLGRLQLKAEQPAEAAATLERLRRAHPGHAATARLSGLIRSQGEDKDKLRQARQLARAGRAEEALKAFRAIFPDAFPDDDFALEHAQLVAATPDGWERGRSLLAELARKHPDDPRYRVALASHVSTRKPVAADTLKTLRELTAIPSVSRQAREAWRRAVIAMDATQENVPALREYIAANPGETAVSERLEQVLQAIAQGRRADTPAREDPSARAKREGWAALDAGRVEEAEARMQEALARNPNDAEALGALGLVRMRQARHADALEHFERAARLDAAGRAKWEDLARTARHWHQQQQAAAAADLERSRLAERRDRASRSRDTARELQGQGREADAIAALEEGAALDPANPWVRHDLARLYAGRGELGRGRALFEELLRARPSDSDARYAQALFLSSVGQEAEAIAALEAIAPAKRSANMTALQVRLATEIVAAERARTMDAHTAEAALAAREGRLDDAIASERRALALETRKESWRYRRLAGWLDQQTPWYSSALDWLHRSGTRGKSQVSAQELPLAWEQGWTRAGRWFMRVAPSRVESGTLDMEGGYEVSTFGSLLLCQPLCDAPPAQAEKGVALGAGFEHGAWKLDLGTTPIGFPVVNVVGGAAYAGQAGTVSWSLEASRRPVTGSLLSYAGTRDPHTGRTWGGVVASGIRLKASRDLGGDYGAWGLAGLYRLTGRNVLDNDKAELMAGGYRRLVNEEDRVLTVGATAMLWRFSENAGEYTFGHGGYYSPRSYRSLSFPVAYAWRDELMSFSVRAAVSVAWSESRRAPFYPTDPALQAQAEALVPVSFVDPFYAGGNNGRSFGRSLAAAAERQVAPGIFIGARMELERSTNYTPNRFLLYVRLAADGVAVRPVSMPPEPKLPGFQY